MIFCKQIDSPIGKINIIEENGYIVKIDINKNDSNKYIKKDTELLNKAAKQLEEYFQGKRKVFDLPIKQKGTEFMQIVWKELTKIPYGKTVTYKEIAENIGNPKASRAVGMANNKNNIPIIVPCHRVIGSNRKTCGLCLRVKCKKIFIKFRRKGKIICMM